MELGPSYPGAAPPPLHTHFPVVLDPGGGGAWRVVGGGGGGWGGAPSLLPVLPDTGTPQSRYQHIDSQHTNCTSPSPLLHTHRDTSVLSSAQRQPAHVSTPLALALPPPPHTHTGTPQSSRQHSDNQHTTCTSPSPLLHTHRASLVLSSARQPAHVSTPLALAPPRSSTHTDIPQSCRQHNDSQHTSARHLH